MASSDGNHIGAWPTDNPAGPAAPRSGSLPPGGTGVPELVSLLLTTRSVEEFLTGLATAAAELLTVSCGITMRRNSEPLTVASSDALAAAVDEVQYGKGEGPCLQAMATGLLVSVPDLSARSVIDQAIGIVMGQQACNASTAFAVLRAASRTRNRKLRDIATDVVTSVGGPLVEPKPFTDPRR